jgi:hypothetical protein
MGEAVKGVLAQDLDATCWPYLVPCIGTKLRRGKLKGHPTLPSMTRNKATGRLFSWSSSKYDTGSLQGPLGSLLSKDDPARAESSLPVQMALVQVLAAIPSPKVP